MKIWTVFRPQGSGFDIGCYEYSLVTTIVEEYLPERFTLYQNYPNPFNPKTNIRFQIADFGYVSLKIYDVLGNEIATLVSEEKPAGNFEVEFNSEGLPSGIYFYQLKCGNFKQTKKMLLLK